MTVTPETVPPEAEHEPADGDESAADAEETTPAAEPPREPQPPEDPAEPPVEPTQPPASDADAERTFRKAEAEATRHANRLSDIFGEAAQDFVPCPLCLPFAPGFVYPPEVAPPPDELKAATLAFLGEAPPDFKADPEAHSCEACEGLGEVLTGSRVPSQRTKLCASCNGAGWLTTRADTPPQPAAPLPVTTAPPAPAPPSVPTPDADPWGRRPGDQLYGVMPGYEGRR